MKRNLKNAWKALKFVNHIEDHIDIMWNIYPRKVCCKICDKTLEEIVKE